MSQEIDTKVETQLCSGLETVSNDAEKTCEWKDLNWKQIESRVYAAQRRIYNASLRGDVNVVIQLQDLLVRTKEAKFLAIRKVTQDNQGKKTAGVDGVKSLSAKERMNLVDSLKLTGRCSPVKRIEIPKSDGTMRKLGIPTIIDRVKQCLVKMALEPQWEARFEPNSYGFRPGRSCHDAIQAIFCAISVKAKYVLDADISKCFDKINHEKLISKLDCHPKLVREIRAWLSSGIVGSEGWFPNMEGTPQGGVISPLLANIALHGMEERIKEYARTLKGQKSKNELALRLIRYADDFVILHRKLEVVETCKLIMEEWLEEIGLELNQEKTSITHTLECYEGRVGFDFLGFNVRQYAVEDEYSGKTANGEKLGFKTLIKPSNKSKKEHSRKLREIVRSHNDAPQAALISRLNPVIKGWCNYYKPVCSKEAFRVLDHGLFNTLKAWAYRRHLGESRKGVIRKYWHTVGGDNWVFSTGNGLNLFKHAWTKIVRHTKVKGEKSPFNGDVAYWAKRMGENPLLSNREGFLLKRDKGVCNVCGTQFKTGDLWEIDHIIPKSLGGKDIYDNLQLLHKHCHDMKTASDGSLTRS